MNEHSSLVIDRLTLEESVARITPEFPYVANLCNMSAFTDRTCPWHWHSEVELFYIRSGALEYHLPSGCHVFRAGEGGFVNSGVLHMTRQLGEEPCLQEEVLFLPKFVGGEENSLIMRRYISPLTDDPGLAMLRLDGGDVQQRRVLEIIRQALESYRRREEGYELEAQEQMIRLWRILLTLLRGRDWVRRPDRRSNSLRVKRMMEFIDGHCGEKLTLEQIARSGYVSARECGRCFQEMLGVSPFQYLMDLRLRRSRTLLIRTDLSVTEIAVSCGFGTSSYFSRMFRLHFGQTPREYRNGQETVRNAGI